MSCTFWLRRKRKAAAKKAAMDLEKARLEAEAQAAAEAAQKAAAEKKAAKKAVAKDDNEGTV